MKLPELDGTYYTLGKPDGTGADIPRVVDHFAQGFSDDVIVFVKAPGGSMTWPVRHFWKNYREPTAKELKKIKERG